MSDRAPSRGDTMTDPKVSEDLAAARRIYGLDLSDDERRAMIRARHTPNTMTDWDVDIPEDRPCYRCGKNPAEGFASVWTNETGERWYCHGDDDESPTCYEATPQV